MGSYFKDPLNLVDPFNIRKLFKSDKKEESKNPIDKNKASSESSAVMENGQDKESFQRIGRAALVDMANPRRGVFEGYNSTRRALTGG